jgi:hypothetical protein
MKKVSTAAAKQSRTFFANLTSPIGLEPGRSLQLLLRTGRSRTHRPGTGALGAPIVEIDLPLAGFNRGTKAVSELPV